MTKAMQANRIGPTPQDKNLRNILIRKRSQTQKSYTKILCISLLDRNAPFILSLAKREWLCNRKKVFMGGLLLGWRV